MIDQFLILKDRQREITDYTQRLEEHEFADLLKQLGAEDYHTLSIATTIKRIAYTARLNKRAQTHLLLMGCELVPYSKLFLNVEQDFEKARQFIYIDPKHSKDTQ